MTAGAGAGPAPATERGGARAGGRGRAQAFAALALLAAVWGYSWVVLKIATRDASPLAVAALRNGLGAAALLVFLAVTRRPLRPPPFVATAVYGVLQTVGFMVPQTIAVSLGGAGKTAILAYTMPFWLALLAWLFLGERIGGFRWGALALAAAGLWLVAGPVGTRPGLASLLGVLTGLLWAASTVWVVRTLIRRGHDLLSVTAWQMVWGSVVLAALALLLPGSVRWTPSLVGALAFLALGANAVGWTLWVFVLSRLPAATAGLGSLATPVVGVALAAAQLHEIPSLGELLGMVLVVTALFVNALAAGGRRA